MSKIGQKRAENDPTKATIFMKNYATGNGSNTTGSGQNMIKNRIYFTNNLMKLP